MTTSNNIIVCNGAGDKGDHCCYLRGNVCKYLTQIDGMNRCGLRVELGSWDAVHTDSRYLADVRSVLDEVESITGNYIKDCGDWGIDPPRCCFLVDE